MKKMFSEFSLTLSNELNTKIIDTEKRILHTVDDKIQYNNKHISDFVFEVVGYALEGNVNDANGLKEFYNNKQQQKREQMQKPNSQQQQKSPTQPQQNLSNKQNFSCMILFIYLFISR